MPCRYSIVRSTGLLVVALAIALVACSAEPDVVAEQRTRIAGLQIGDDDPRVTAPPVEPAPTTPAPATPPPEDPPVDTPADTTTIADLASLAQGLLLVDGDVPWWEIGEPQRTQGRPDPYGRSDCPMLDVVRSIDSFDRFETIGGSGAIDFSNSVVDTASGPAAWRILDAALRAAEACPQFTDERGEGWIEPVLVPSEGMWESAGLVVAVNGEPVSLGYWVSETLVVKLRVVGPDAASEFPMLAQAVSDKIHAVTASIEPPETTDEFDDPWNDDSWMSDPLAGMILEASELGDRWTRAAVFVDDGMPGGDDEFCGVTTPAQAPGLSALFELDGTGTAMPEMPEMPEMPKMMVSQAVMNATPELAQQWIDVYTVLASCGATDESFLQVTYEFVATTPDQVAGADDLAVLRATVADGSELTATMITGVVRKGGLIVQIVMSQYVDELGPPVDEPTVEELLRLLQASLD